jgi:hypothetical protein
LHQVGDLFELNVKRQCQKVNLKLSYIFARMIQISALSQALISHVNAKIL